MNLVTRDIQNVNDLWWIWGIGQTEWFWSSFQSGGGFYESQWLTISHKPLVDNGHVAMIDMSGNNQYDDPRNADRVTFDLDDHQVIFPKNVEYFDSSLDTTTQITWVDHYGATTDGSLDKLYADVGNHEFNFTTAIKDSFLHLGAGWDVVNLIDHRDVPDTQYWAMIRRDDNALDAYSLLTGRRIRMEDGLESRNGDEGNHNFGEVEILTLGDSRNGGTITYKPGVDLPTGVNNRGVYTNIDLRSDGATHSDSFNLAYFNFIRYTSDNVWVGEATVHDGTNWSTPSDRRVTTDVNLFDNQTYDVDASILDGQLSVIGQSRNGTHDLIVAEQETAIDGQFRVYSFNVASGLYNEFNEVYLGTSLANISDKSAIMDGRDITDIIDTEWSYRVALYGFGGNDTLTGGAGRDYLFGGQSVYNLTVNGATGNQVTGGVGADYFGVGNTNSAGVVTGDNTTIGTTTTTGEFLQGYATDVILDWHAGEDTLVVLTNGVAVIGGLRNGDGLVSLNAANTIDLRDYAAIATSDQDFDGARGGDTWDKNINGATPLDYVFLNQATRDSHSIENEADRTVVNEGLIVIRGLDGSDTIYGSAGNDYIYGNNANNFIDISNGGNDRIYYDMFDGAQSKHYVKSFTTSAVSLSGSGAGADKFYLNKGVIDAFYSDGSDRSLVLTSANDVIGDYVESQPYDPGLNFLHSPFYNPSIASPNSVHNSEDGEAYYENGSGGSDQTSSLIGLGMVAAGRILLGVPFVGPIIGGALIASGTLLNGVGFEVIKTTRHLNATYDGDVDAYMNVLSDTGTSTINGQLLQPTHNLTGLDTSIRFHQFFEEVDAGDGYIPVVEFTAHPGQGIYGYFALHSNTHTFVYLVASKDNLVENSEAILVAQIEGLLKAEDFAIYDGEADIYNAAVQAPIIIVEPTVTKLGDDMIENILIETEKRFADVDNPLKLTVTVPGDVVTGQIRLYDGVTLIFDSGAATTINSAVTLSTSVFAAGVTTFVLQDNRNIGTVAQQTDSADIDEDNQFVLRDSIVNYTVEFVDSVTGIGARDSVGRVDVAGGDVIIDGGDGANDMLTIFETNDFINSAADEKIIGMEKILIVAEQDPDTEVYTPITLLSWPPKTVPLFVD